MWETKRDASLIPRWGRSSEEGNGNPLQYSFLENPMDRGAQWATDDRVTESQTPEATQHASMKYQNKVKKQQSIQGVYVYIYIDRFDSKYDLFEYKDFTCMCIYVYTHRYMQTMCVCM